MRDFALAEKNCCNVGQDPVAEGSDKDALHDPRFGLTAHPKVCSVLRSTVDETFYLNIY